jgi:hypothetical protein
VNILQVYAKKLEAAKILKGGVAGLDFEKLSALTENKSGCDIEEIISKCIGTVLEEQEEGNHGALVDQRMIEDLCIAEPNPGDRDEGLE